MIIRSVASLIFLTFVWFCIAGFHFDFHGLAFAILAPSISFLLSYRLNLLPINNHFKIRNSAIYFMWLLKEIIISSIDVVKIAWRRDLLIKPVLEPIKSSIKENDYGVVLYANSITLTPGTVTVSLENDVLLVHALDSSFLDGLEGGVMERKILKIIK